MRAHPALLGPDATSGIARLAGVRLPNVALPSTMGGTVRLRELGPLGVVFAHPMTGSPGVLNPDSWDQVGDARGCTADAHGFRDLHLAFRSVGARVLGLSSQVPEHQAEAAVRLALPFPLLSDPKMELADSIGLPTFELHGLRVYRRLTLIVAAGVVQHVIHPVEQPGGHAEQVLAWLRETGREAGFPPLEI